MSYFVLLTKVYRPWSNKERPNWWKGLLWFTFKTTQTRFQLEAVDGSKGSRMVWGGISMNRRDCPEPFLCWTCPKSQISDHNMVADETYYQSSLKGSKLYRYNNLSPIESPLPLRKNDHVRWNKGLLQLLSKLLSTRHIGVVNHGWLILQAGRQFRKDICLNPLRQLFSMVLGLDSAPISTFLFSFIPEQSHR